MEKNNWEKNHFRYLSTAIFPISFAYIFFIQIRSLENTRTI